MVANADEESKLWAKGYKHVAGIDESGMGSLAGDVYVAAVVFPTGIDFKKLLPGLNDSKTKTEEQREDLYVLVKKYALTYAVATASIEEINELNIYWARFLAARRALNKLSVEADYVMMDGNKIVPEITTPQHAIVKGDQKSISIAAASILAKVERDRYVKELSSLVHPDFEWESNKAYYCPAHIGALKKHGRTEWHRDKFIEKFV